MIDAGTMTNRPAREPGSPGQDASRAAGDQDRIRRATEDAGDERRADFLATLRAQLRDGAALGDAQGATTTGAGDGEDAAGPDELLEVVPAPEEAVGYGATLLGLIDAHAELDTAAQDALAEALADAGLVDGKELDATELADVLVEEGLVDGAVLDAAELAGALDEQGLVDGEALTDGLADALAEEGAADTSEEAGDATDGAPDLPAADAAPEPDDEDDETGTEERPEPAVAAAETSSTTRSSRDDGERGEVRGTDRARQVTPPERQVRTAPVRADHPAPASERAGRPEFTRMATEAEAFRFATATAPSAEANAEVAQATLRAAARMSALPPQVQRILDAAQRLENLPPPRHLTLDLGEVRVRVAMDDGGLRLSVVSGDPDVGDDLLRDARDLLEQQGFDLARDGDGEPGGDEQAGASVPGSRDQDAALARRARRGGLRL